MDKEERSLRDAVKNARTAFYKNKGLQKKQSRKETRKTKRLEKKAKQREFLTKKTDESNKPDSPAIPTQKKKKRKRKRKKVVTKIDHEENEEFDYKRYAYEAANKQDERIISSLGKKLKANKQSEILNLFKDDGLDYILEVCDPLTEDYNPGDSDEEYLAAKKKNKNKQMKKESCYEDTKDLSKKLLFDDRISTKNTKKVHFDKFVEEDEEILAAGEVSESDEDDGLENKMMDDGWDDEMSDGMDRNNGLSDDKDEFMEKDHIRDPLSDPENMGSGLEENIDKNCSQSRYVPPALRKLQQANVDQEQMKRERLRKQLKGLLNKLSGSSLHYVTNEIEVLYSKNSRNTVNELLCSLTFESLITSSIMAERFIMEHSVIIAVLHKTTESEIGSYSLQLLVEKFDEYHQTGQDTYGGGKQCQNIVVMICYFYLLKITDCLLIYDVVRRLVKEFSEQDIEMVLLILKVCGTEIRKDDPGSLKDVILEIQAKAMTSVIKDQSRVRFMLEMINALKNNNMRKIQNHDRIVFEDGKRFLKSLLKERDSSSSVQLKVSLDDLLNAKEKGKWWVVGSAWTGRGPVDKVDDTIQSDVKKDTKLLEIAKKQRMNTNLRKDIFCAMMTSEDYMNAFERLLKLNLKEKQSREIIHVLLDCCLQEKSYNPFYAHLADKFCEYAHSHQVTLQYSLWDRFKTMSTLSKQSSSNMASLLSHLVASKSLSLAVLKVVSFGVLDKPSIRFFIRFFKIIFVQYPETVVKAVFWRISGQEKLSMLREGIKVFLRHFLTPKESFSKDVKVDIQVEKINELIEIADSALEGRDYIPL